jgi:hypothetical protein
MWDLNPNLLVKFPYIGKGKLRNVVCNFMDQQARWPIQRVSLGPWAKDLQNDEGIKP